MKSKNKKQSSVYAITLLGILLTTFFIYSCSTDDAEEYNHTNEAETEANLMAQTHGLILQTWETGNILVDSVANGEGNGNSKCEQLKQAAYEQAEKDYYDAVNRCRKESSTPACYVLASAKYQRDIDIANRNYEACIQGN